MKKITLLAILGLCATFCSAQSTKTKIKSYLGDSITVVKGYTQLTPIIITVAGDTARSMIWYTGPISRDSTAQTNIAIVLYDKNANALATINKGIAESAYTKWSGLFTAIDNYIHNQISRIVLH